MGAIYRRELGSFFNSAIGPVFLTVFYLGSGVLFWLFCLNYARTDMSNYFAWMRLVMVLILPLLTMRLLSEERAQKTDQGLLTAPVSLGGIVLGKYFAALTVYAMGIAIVFVYAILLSFFGTVAWSTSCRGGERLRRPPLRLHGRWWQGRSPYSISPFKEFEKC